MDALVPERPEKAAVYVIGQDSSVKGPRLFQAEWLPGRAPKFENGRWKLVFDVGENQAMGGFMYSAWEIGTSGWVIVEEVTPETPL